MGEKLVGLGHPEAMELRGGAYLHVSERTVARVPLQVQFLGARKELAMTKEEWDGDRH